MTVHHDKTVYGKIYSGSETINEDTLDAFLKELNDDDALSSSEFVQNSLVTKKDIRTDGRSRKIQRK